MLTIAIPKGRLLDDALSLLADAGVLLSEAQLASRRLAIEDLSATYRVIFVKPADVTVYVEHGIADCGIVGLDVLMESDADLLLPLDLGIGCCRIIVAARNGKLLTDAGTLRVATKYPRVAAAYFGSLGIPAEIIELSGSVELAPVLDLSDCIVDLVETGRTLKENGLTVVAEIARCSGRFVVNRASYQLKAKAVTSLRNSLEDTVAGRSNSRQGESGQ